MSEELRKQEAARKASSQQEMALGLNAVKAPPFEFDLTCGAHVQGIIIKWTSCNDSKCSNCKTARESVIKCNSMNQKKVKGGLNG